MRRYRGTIGAIGLFILPAALLAFGAPGRESGPQAEAPRPKAVLYRLEGELTQTMVTSLERARRTAKAIGAGALVIEIDTPGGEMGIMEQLRDLVFAASQDDGLETAAFVDNNADSAGALIAMACRSLYMAPLAHIGSATPIILNPGLPFGAAPIKVDEDLARKIKARVLAIFRATAGETGRNVYIAQAMVDPDIELILARVDGKETVTTREKFIDERTRLGPARAVEIEVICPKGELLNITAQEALDLGFIDGIPKSRGDLLENYLKVDEKDVAVVSRSWSEGLVDFIDSIHWLLLVAGLVFLYIEFKVPGFGLPGILGISCLAVLFFSQYMAGLAEIPEILLIVAGLALVLVEIFVLPGTIVPAAVGLILVVVGALLSFQPFIVPHSPWHVELLERNIIHMGISVVTFAAVAMVLTRFLPRTSLFRRLVLDTGTRPDALKGSALAIDDVHPDLKVAAGDTGEVLKELRPVGRIRIGGSSLEAQSEGEFIGKGERVRVVRVTGSFIFVRKIKDDSP